MYVDVFKINRGDDHDNLYTTVIGRPHKMIEYYVFRFVCNMFRSNKQCSSSTDAHERSVGRPKHVSVCMHRVSVSMHLCFALHSKFKYFGKSGFSIMVAML